MSVEVTGWGRVKAEGQISNFLRQAFLTVLSFNDCRDTSYGHLVTEEMICAYKDDTDACQVYDDIYNWKARFDIENN